MTSMYANIHHVLLHPVGQTLAKELVEERDQGTLPEEGWHLQPARHCVSLCYDVGIRELTYVLYS
ncbi:hypothetical protein AB205_0115330 [Aquarana catesbeiana]|uniref:Uncharacterized protein n=1 Tax=Aquarana catesbeiana TaxID=8400 RepID=A0A2G9R5M7_AQUCT|nr:hypothetical protein AB205_0115330 [Aquarana catesbeiana]